MGPNEPVDPFVAELQAWAASARAAEAAAARAGARALQDQAAAESTWAGLAVDLAERADTVVVVSTTGRWSGRLVGAGRDFLVLDRQGAGPVLVVYAAVLTLSRSGPPLTRPSGRRPPALDLGFVGALEALMEEGSPVGLWAGPQPSVGRLTGLGRDFVTLAADAARPSEIYIRLDAIDAVEIR